MLLRRLVALLSSATMLHLSVVAGDAACAEHDASAGHGAATHSTMGNSGHGHDAATAHAGMAMTTAPTPRVQHGAHAAEVGATKTSTTPCDTPAQPRCCESMTSCSVSGTVAERVSIAPTLPVASLTERAPTSVPTSVRQAPEPPPPKA